MDLTTQEWLNTKLLLHADGDESGTHSIYFVSGASFCADHRRTGKQSLYLDGTGYAYGDDHSDFTLGTNTIEAWILIETGESIDTGTDDVRSIFSAGDTDNNALYAFGIGHHSGWGTGVRMNLAAHNGSWTNATSGEITFTYDVWHHVAATYNSGTVEFWLDGVSQGTDSVTAPAPNGNFYIGCQESPTLDEFFTGYIDGVRLSDSVRYSTIFTPGDLSDDANTLFLFNPEGDSSRIKNTITPVGAPMLYNGILTSVGLSDGQVWYFENWPSDADYLNIADSSEFSLGSNSFTIALYVRADDTVGPFVYVAKSETSGDQRSFELYQDNNNPDRLVFKAYDDGTSTPALTLTGSTALASNTWRHVAVTYDGTTCRLFLDGAVEDSSVVSLSIYDSTAPVTVGTRLSGGSPTESLRGHVEELIIVNGSALWTGAFTPPAARYSGNDPVLTKTFSRRYFPADKVPPHALVW